MNSVQLVGRLTRDVDLRYTSNGTAVATFTLAVNRNFTNRQGEREADFITCVVWRRQAETLANYTRKGTQIGVEGRIQTRNYENQQGQRVYVTEVVVDQFHFLEPRSVTEQRPRGDDQAGSSFDQTNQYQNSYNQNYQSQNTGSGSFQDQSQNNYNQAPAGGSQGNDSQGGSDSQGSSFFNQSSNDQSSDTGGSPFMNDGQPIDVAEDDLPF